MKATIEFCKPEQGITLEFWLSLVKAVFKEAIPLGDQVVINDYITDFMSYIINTQHTPQQLEVRPQTWLQRQQRDDPSKLLHLNPL